MSVEAITWALNDAPVTDPSSVLVLIGLANHARPDGTAAFPSIATLVAYTRLSERTVRTHLRALEDAGVIRRCDDRIVAAHIERADRRPRGYDLVMHGGQLTSDTPERGATGDPDEGQPQPPAHGTGGNSRPNGGQLTTERGAAAAPEPSMNHPEPSVSPSRPTDRPTDDHEDPRVTAAITDLARRRLAATANAPTDRGKRRRYLRQIEANLRAEDHVDDELAAILATHPDLDTDALVAAWRNDSPPLPTVSEWLAGHRPDLPDDDLAEFIDRLITEGRLRPDPLEAAG